MGCGQARNRGASTPTKELPAVFTDPSWELRGKLPVVVLQGWAKILGVPFLSRNKNAPRPNFELVTKGEDSIHIGRAQVLPETLDAMLEEIQTRTEGKSIEAPVLAARESDSLSPPATKTENEPILSSAVAEAAPEEMEKQFNQSGGISPLPPAQLREESEDEAAPVEDETLRTTRLAREKAAEEKAAEIAALQRAEMERQQMQQSSLVDAQKNLADSILAKYT